MFCFGRKKCLKKDDEFSRLQEETPSTVKKGILANNKLRNENNYNNNISNVTSQHVFVPNGKQLQVIHAGDVIIQQRNANARPSNTLHSQTLNYKHLQNSNNVYRPGRNSVVVQRSHSAHYPTKPIISFKEPVRATCHAPERETSYTKLDDIHFDRIITDSKSVEMNTSVPLKTNVSECAADPKENDILEQTLAQLDDTLKDYCVDAFESDSSDDETNKAKSRKFNNQSLTIEPLEKERSSTDSGLTSPTDSLSSNQSVTLQQGIISKHVNRTGNKRSSVSFRLPANHVDKPYNPIQFAKCKPKSSCIVNITSTHISHHNPQNEKPKHIPSTSFTTSIPYKSVRYATYNNKLHVPTLCVWDSQNKLWHTKEGVIYRENVDMSTHAQPFRGSFLNLFYGKYANNDVTSSDQSQQGKAYLAPGISQKIESFESLTDTKYDCYAKTSVIDQRRHSIAHY